MLDLSARAYAFSQAHRLELVTYQYLLCSRSAMYTLTVGCLIWRNKRVLPSRKRWPSLCLFCGHREDFNELISHSEAPAVARDVVSFVSDGVSRFTVSYDKINLLRNIRGIRREISPAGKDQPCRLVSHG